MATAATRTSLLSQKHAVLFGAGGAIGTAVAKEFASQDATVFLSGHHLAAVDQLAATIRHDGGTAHAAEVDALDERAVDAYLDDVVRKAGRIDVVLNVMGPQARDYANATPTMTLPLDKFMLPLTTLVASQFVTARVAARSMVKQQAGVILFITALPGRGLANAAAIGAAFGAMESLLRTLAVELGPAGIRVVGLRPGAMVETRTMQQSLENAVGAFGLSKEQIVAGFAQRMLVQRFTTVEDTARLAAFLASDSARTITGAIVNASSGAVID